MPSKAIYLAAGAAVLIVGAGLVVLLRAPGAPAGNNSRGAVSQPNSYTVSSPNQVSVQTPPAAANGQVAPSSAGAGTARQITLVGVAGLHIQSNDILNSSSTKADPSNPGHYFLGNVPDLQNPAAPNAPSYVIEYTASTSYFGVSLLREPIKQARSAAEQYLMKDLGINENDMCQLNYMVSVPAWVNQTYAGESLGFSFCRDAQALP